MYFFIPFWIGIKFINSCYRNKIISLISFFSILGIAFGISSLIIVLSIMNGFQKELNNRILSLIPHGEIKVSSKNLNQSIALIKKVPEVYKINTYITFIGLIENKKKIKTIQIKGIDFYSEKKFSNLMNFVKYNWKDFLYNKDCIVLGKKIAKKINIKLNDWITIITMKNGKDNNDISKIKKTKLKVVGMIDSQGILDSILGIIPISKIYNFIDSNYEIVIAIKINNPLNINNVLNKILAHLNYKADVKSWINSYGYIYNDIIIVKTIAYIAMIMVILISCFNNVSVLIMLIKNKNKEIAILQTLGASKKFINNIFIFYGFIFAIISSSIGFFCGIIMTMNINSIIKGIESIIRKKIFNEDTYFIDFIPSEIKNSDLLIILIISFILCILSTYYPAKRANSITPINLLNKF